ncbi:MAG: Hsp20/alpha crystallin family protein [Ignavibacteriales bacterium]|nr:MAG: Hsp20/alpha crystallin family protein [Ignavibacteriales bacterium]
MTLVRFEPFKELEYLNNRLRRIFDETPVTVKETPGIFNPRLNVFEDNQNLYIEAEIPGVNKEDLKISLQDNTITISGEKKFEDEKKEKNYYRVERRYGSFRRSFSLPVEVNDSKVEAKFENGVLKVSLEKVVEQQPEEKVITIQ